MHIPAHILDLMSIIDMFIKGSLYLSFQISAVASGQGSTAEKLSCVNDWCSLCRHEILHLEIEEFIQPIHFKPAILSTMQINKLID